MKDVVRYAKNHVHRLKAMGASVYYGWPSKKMKVIGITGTDGKTTTTHLIHHILASSGAKASMMSTVYAKIGSEVHETGLHVTTPDAIDVQRLLASAASAGEEYFVLETTSHGLHQNRNWGIHYDVSIITNITHEHLDYHKTYENYVQTKARLLSQSRLGIINADDGAYDLLRSYAKKNHCNIKTYGLKDTETDYHFDARKRDGLDLTDYNAYNYLAAYSVCLELGVSKQDIRAALKTYKLPKGRLEQAYHGAYDVIVDFAHTSNSIESLLAGLRSKIKGRIIHVFGSAGMRDREKRPLMGAASSKYSDVIILTEEDYRTEDPMEIASELREGMDARVSHVDARDIAVAHTPFSTVIVNRGEAIAQAVALAKRGDVVVCTGKSHERSLCRGRKECDWNEFAAVEQAVAIRKKAQKKVKDDSLL